MFSALLELIILISRSEKNKDLEILLLRRQLAMVERKLDRPLHVSRAEKMALAVRAIKLKTGTGQTARQMNSVIQVFQPETVFKWHREMVRRKWTYNKRGRGGRPRTDKELERLVVRLAQENGWGYGKLEGELVKLGYYVAYYNGSRAHQRLEQQFPKAPAPPAVHGPIRCRDVLGGIIHDYYREVA